MMSFRPMAAAGADPRQQLLAQMHDVLAPAPVGAWPPAPGWIALTLLALLLLGGALWWAGQLWRRRRYRRAALAEWRRIQDAERGHTEQIRAQLTLLKRVFFSAYPSARRHFAGLRGEAWFALLQALCARPNPVGALPERIDRALFQGTATDSDQGAREGDAATAAALAHFVKHWIRYHYSAGHARARARLAPQNTGTTASEAATC